MNDKCIVISKKQAEQILKRRTTLYKLMIYLLRIVFVYGIYISFQEQENDPLKIFVALLATIILIYPGNDTAESFLWECMQEEFTLRTK